MMVLKCCTQYVSTFGKLGSGHRRKDSFHSNPKERQCQRMFNLPQNCTHLTHQQNKDKKFPSQASIVRELRTSRFSSWIQKKQGNQRSNCQHLLDHRKKKKQENSRKTSPSASLTMPKPLTVWITTNWKILQEMGIPDYLPCLPKNLYAGQEATVRTGHGTMDWFQIAKGVCQSCHPAYLTYMQSTS